MEMYDSTISTKYYIQKKKIVPEGLALFTPALEIIINYFVEQRC